MFHNASTKPSPDNLLGVPKPSLVRQMLTNTWLAALLILSGLFLLCTMVGTIWGGQGLLAVQHKQHDIMRLTREIEILEQENARLVHEIQRLRVDMVYVEKIAREEIGLMRPGELVFEFVE